jgi:hypothetical protein
MVVNIAGRNYELHREAADDTPGPDQATGRPEAQVQRGRCFQFVVPQGWRVIEEGQFAVVLKSADNNAISMMAGNAGFPANYNPAEFVFRKLSAMNIENLQIGQPRQSQPMAGCQAAWEFEIAYTSGGVPCRGVARCSVADVYAMRSLVMTVAASTAQTWSEYANWLPQVSTQVAATNGAAFGARGMMATNLQITKNEGERNREYREWSKNNWDQVTDARDKSQDQNNRSFREGLGSSLTYVDPYQGKTVELSNQYQYYWVNRQGGTFGTNNPADNPNVGSTAEWSRMNRAQLP